MKDYKVVPYMDATKNSDLYKMLPIEHLIKSLHIITTMRVEKLPGITKEQ